MPDETMAELAARLRAQIRAEITAESTLTRQPRADAPGPIVGVHTAARTNVTPAARGRPALTLHGAAPADLTLPSFLEAGLTIAYRTVDAYTGEDGRQETEPGYLNAHVNFAHGSLVTIDVRDYYAVGDEERAVSYGSGAVVGDHNSAGVYWMNPRVLEALAQDAPSSHEGGVSVRRGSGEARAGRVDTVTVARERDRYMYDAETGLLLSLTRAATEDDSLIEMTYLEQRRLRLPWASEAVPDWMPRTHGMTFQGNNTVVRSTSLVLQTVTLSIEFDALAHEVFLAKVASRIESGPVYPAEESRWEMPCATAMLYPLWISPDALRRLSPGTLIDDDPVTRFRMTFQGVEGAYAVLAEEGPLERTAYYFDMNTGVFFGFRGQRPTPEGDGDVQTQNWLVAQRQR
jgi:hypothetical protein